MKPCRQIKNDGEKLSYIKSSRKDSLQTWRWRRTEWSEGVFEKNWGRNISGRKKCRIPQLVWRNNEKASGVIAGKSDRRWSQREREGLMPVSGRAFSSSGLSVRWHHPCHALHRKRRFSLNPTCISHGWTLPLASAGEAVMLSSAQLFSLLPGLER